MISLGYAKPTGIGSTALVTGANRGVGLGYVKVLLKRSDVRRVFAACRRPEEAKVRVTS